MVTVSTRPEPGSKMVPRDRGPAGRGRPPLRHRLSPRRRAHACRVPARGGARQVIDRFVGRGSVWRGDRPPRPGLVRQALDQTDVIPIDQPEVDIDAASLAEGEPSRSPRPSRSAGGGAGSYTGFAFGLEVPEITDEQVGQVLTELREQRPTLRPIDGAARPEGRRRQREVRRHDRRRAVRRAAALTGCRSSSARTG